MVKQDVLHYITSYIIIQDMYSLKRIYEKW